MCGQLASSGRPCVRPSGHDGRHAPTPRYADPELRKKHLSEAHTGLKRSAEHRANISKGGRKRYEDPDEREKTGAKSKAFWTKKTGKCKICKREAALVRDHDHITGKRRGLICQPCNLGLGMLGDNIEGLKRAIAYLERRR